MSPTFDKFCTKGEKCQLFAAAKWSWRPVTDYRRKYTEVWSSQEAPQPSGSVKQEMTYPIRVTHIWSSEYPPSFRYWKVTAEKSTVSTNFYCPASVCHIGEEKNQINCIGYLSLYRSLFSFRRPSQQFLIELMKILICSLACPLFT